MASDLRGKSIGFIGLGAMGAGMAWSVLGKGFRLTVYDVRPEAAAKHEAAGAKRAASIAELAADCDVVITMLPDVPDVEAVLLGAGGVRDHASPGAVVIDMSTIDPVSSLRFRDALAERSIEMIDCPVGRGVDQAWTGSLALMIGGNAELVEEMRPLLASMGEVLNYCGPNGRGCAMKLVNNFLSAGIVTCIAESIAMGLRFGLDLDMMLDISRGTGTYNKWMHEMMPRKAFLADAKPGFATRLALKDQRMTVAAAEVVGMDLKLGRAALEWLELTNQNFRNDDFSFGVLRTVSSDLPPGQLRTAKVPNAASLF